MNSQHEWVVERNLAEINQFYEDLKSKFQSFDFQANGIILNIKAPSGEVDEVLQYEI